MRPRSHSARENARESPRLARPGPLATFAVLALAALQACRIPQSARRAEGDLANDDYPQALANYQAALGEARSGSQRRWVEERRDETARHLALTHIADAERLLELDQADETLRLALDLRAATWLEGAGLDEELTDLLTRAAEQLTRRIESVESDARYLGTILRWCRLLEASAVKTLPHHADRLARITRVRHRLRDRHLARAEDAATDRRSGSEMLHLALAIELDPDRREELLPLLERATARTRALGELDFHVSGDSPRCAWVEAALRRALGPGSGEPVRLELVLERCDKKEKRTINRDVLEIPSQRETVELVEEKYYERSKEGGAPLLKLRNVPVTRVEATTATISRQVHMVEYALTITGRVGKPDTFYIPIGVNVHTTDSEFWSPTGEKVLSITSADDLAERSLASVATSVFVSTNAQRHQRRRDLQREGLEAAGAGIDPVAEHLLTAAVLATARIRSVHPADVPDRLAELWLKQRFGFDDAELVRLTSGQPIIAPAERQSSSLMDLPSPTGGEEEDLRLEPEEVHRGVNALGGGVGVDVYGSVRTSPLESADFASGVGVRFRLDAGQIFLRGDSKLLGGDAGGAEIGFTGRPKGLQSKRVKMRIGLSYERQSAPDGQSYAGVHLPIWFGFRLAKPILLELELRPNLLHFKEWIAPSDSDPSYFTPIAVGLGFDVTSRGYLRVRSEHHLGSTEALGAVVEAGIRL